MTLRRRRITLKNRWSNHTGLGGTNLLLNNVWVMYRYDIRKRGKPHRGWLRGTRLLIRATITGWFGRTGIFNCRIVRTQSEGTDG